MVTTPMSTLRAEKHSILGWTGQVFAWFVIAGVLVLLTLAVLVPRVGGATPYTILTGSMEPGLPPGTLVVVKPVPADRIAIGSVITYQLDSGRPTVVTHRVVRVGIDGTGDRIFSTQGDANNAPDSDPVLPAQVKGEVWYSVPYLGRVNNAIGGDERSLVVYAVAFGLILYAGVMFASSARDRRRGRRPERHEVAS
ncbi:signal peptidase I [Aeromicrobium sp.]|uniref:signal peptidase I n=1 Tax=Aeromicrobium sp. TaxID=1871063 RepID=UPI003C4ACC38